VIGAGLIGPAGAERKRVEAVVQTLTHLRSDSESLAEVAHDTRNMVTALGLYCDLLEEPGVLTPAYAHYANELRLVATASRRLVEKLLALDVRLSPVAGVTRLASFAAERTGTETLSLGAQEQARRWDMMPPEPIDNLAAELLANRNLLAALAGPSIALTVDVEGGAVAVRLSGEDLTRILVNLVKNAAEAMPEGGRIQLGLSERAATADSKATVLLTVEDNGPGIPQHALDQVFDSGFTTHATSSGGSHGWPATHRGLGLSITRSIVEEASGQIQVANRPSAGARFEIVLPVDTR